MYILVAYFWTVGVSQIFGSTPGNPFGLTALNEIYLALATAYAFFIVALGRTRKGDLLFLAVPILAMVLSAFIADSVYGQPFYLGLVEERRMLWLYLYFPLRDLTERLGYDAMRRIILNTALFCASLGFLWYLDFIPGWNELSKRFAMADRANFGSVFVAIALLLGFRQERIYKTLFLFAFLVLVAQTRQVLIALIIAVIAMYVVESIRSRKPFLLSAFLIMAILVLIPAAVDPYAIVAYLPSSFQELARTEYLESSARSRAFADVFNHFRPFGHGALSNLYRGGFALHFGPYFFLTDIGFIGTIHRYGWLALIYCGLTMYFIVSIWRRAGLGEANQFMPIFGATIALLAAWPTAGILEYRGGFIAMLAGLAAVCGQRQWVIVRRRVPPLADGPPPQLQAR